MTLESEHWQSHTDQSRLKETKTLEVPHAADDKRVLKIRTIFKSMLDTATGPRGLPQLPGTMAEYSLTRSNEFKMGRDIPGYVRTALFDKGLWLQVTMADEEDLARTRHTLEIIRRDKDPDTPDTYQIADLHVERGVEPVDRYMEGVEQIAAGMDDLFELGQVVRAFKIEADHRWQQRVSDNQAAYNRTPAGLLVSH